MLLAAPMSFVLMVRVMQLFVMVMMEIKCCLTSRCSLRSVLGMLVVMTMIVMIVLMMVVIVPVVMSVIVMIMVMVVMVMIMVVIVVMPMVVIVVMPMVVVVMVMMVFGRFEAELAVVTVGCNPSI